MAKLVYVAGPLFSEAERAFLEQIVDTLAKLAGLDPLADFVRRQHLWHNLLMDTLAS